MPDRIYLDNASTSWPKPESVYQTVDWCQRQLGAPAGRSGYREAVEADRLQLDARRRTAQFLGATEAERIIFTSNGTDSLNLALHGLLRPGDHVVTSVVEHNSVLRPLRLLEQDQQLAVTRVPCDGRGVVEPDAVAKAIRPTTKLIALVHASNVTGALQPAKAIGRIAAEHEVLFLLDAAQSVGQMPVNVRDLGAHLLAAPAHKGLLGPLGLGLLYVDPGVELQLRPIRQGGTGTFSEEDRQPATLPDKYESGNVNLPAILGLGAGVSYLTNRGMDEIRSHHRRLTTRLLEGMESIGGVTVYGPRDADRRVGVVSIRVAGYHPQEVAATLDAVHSIQVRAGLHCAPLLHRALGTFPLGGAVRFSFGVFTTEREVDAAVHAVAEIAAASTT